MPLTLALMSRLALARIIHGEFKISRRALAKWHSLCVFVNRWALAPGLNSLANSLNTKPEDSDNRGLAPFG